MMRASYDKGSYPDLGIDWSVNGVLVTDLADRTITLTVFPFGGATAFAKTTGFVVQDLNVDDTAPSPNLVVEWSQVTGEELDALDTDIEYVLLFDADGPEDNLRMVGQIIVRFNAPNIGYCEITDLLLGDLNVSASLNKYNYVNSAAAEMDGEIGQRYTLPLDLAAAPDWVALKLKTINQNLATGRLICAQAAGSEDNKLNAYGDSLIQLAYRDLCRIVDGSLALTGIAVDPTSFRVTAPAIHNHDAVSAVDEFEQIAMRRRGNVFPRDRWRPGTPA